MSEEKASPRLRSRQCMFVLYPESQQTAIDYCKQNLPCAWALHDKDVHTQASFDTYVKKHNGEAPDWLPGDLKKPHVHFVCSFPNARYFSGIAKEIGVETNVIRKVNNLYKAYVYLWHMLDLDKYQYSKDIVGMHDFEVPSEHAGMSQLEDDQVQILLDMPDFQSIQEMSRWAYENGCWASYRKNYSMWRDHFVERSRQRDYEADVAANKQLGERLRGMDKVMDADFQHIIPDALADKF